MNLPPLRHWGIGLALSIAVAWASGAVLLDTVQPMLFDLAVNRFVAMPGTVSRTRGEGWASSVIGEHGIRGLPGGLLPQGANVVFWGDSFVEGVQVEDDERMAQAFTTLARQAGLDLHGVGIGTGGDTLIDGILKTGDYAPALGSVALNVYVVERITDVLPDNPRPCRAAFFSRPKPHLTRNDCPPTDLALCFAPAMRKYELAWAYSMYLQLRDVTLRLAPGPVAPALKPAAQPAPQDLLRVWDYLLGQVRSSASSAGILFLYAPDVPRLSAGSMHFADPEAVTVDGFSAACRLNSVPFINLGPRFVAHYQATGRLPMGFFNSPPGTGHLNQDGHRLAAEAVLQYIKEHRDALLAP